MNQESLSELIAQGLVKNVRVSEKSPSKGKSLHALNKKVWIVTVVLMNNSETMLLSTRGSPREWASLDRLTKWLRSMKLNNYQVIQMEILP